MKRRRDVRRLEPGGTVPSGPGRRVRACRGVTIVEAVIAVSVLAAGAFTALSVTVSSLRLDATNRETKAAFDAARVQLERLRAEPWERVVPLFNGDATDDPDGAGTAPGDVFSVRSLKATTAGAAGAGEFVLPVDDTGAVREDLNLPELGLPRDLDGDGAVDSADHTADAMILPVLVRVRWTGSNGAREIFVGTVLHR